MKNLLASAGDTGDQLLCLGQDGPEEEETATTPVSSPEEFHGWWRLGATAHWVAKSHT